MFKKRCSIIILLVFAGAISCNLIQRFTEKIEELLPREIELAGWKIDVPPKNYFIKDLQDYILDMTKIELLQLYGFKELSVAKYKSISDSEKKITAEIYRMNSSLNAFGILSRDRFEGNREIDICMDSYSNQNAIFSRKGNYYIIIKREKEYENSKKDLSMYAEIICSKIKNINETLPDYTSLFGEDDNRFDLIYRIDSHPKINTINNIFIRKIKVLTKIKTIFFVKRDSSYISLGDFSKLLKDKKKPFTLSSAGKAQIAFRKINDDEYIFVSVYNEWIFGIYEANSITEGKKIINYLNKGLLEFLKK